MVRLAPCKAARRPAVKLELPPPVIMPVEEALGAAEEPLMTMLDESWAIDRAAMPARVSDAAAYFMIALVVGVVCDVVGV